MAKKLGKTPKPTQKMGVNERKKALGKKIRELRMAHGYTNAMKFAFDYELSPNMVYMWERGSNISIESLSRLADIFKVPLSEFFKDVG